MPFIFNPFACSKWLVLLIVLVLSCTVEAQSQTCSPPANFEAVYYDHAKADYRWDFAADAVSYELAIEVNGKGYTKMALPGSATSAEAKFSPLLKHQDRVSALLTKTCIGGDTKSATFDFIIIDDIIVYLSGSTQAGEPRLVEPVTTILDNLIPSEDVCGRCEADFFRLEAGFYGPYHIAVSSAIGPIEQLRFLKSELCDCLDGAITSGILNEAGGPGPQFNGTPFNCRVTPYLFARQDCAKKPQEERMNFRPEEAYPNTLRVQAIPNPVLHHAQIRYHLPQASDVQLTLHDLAGRFVRNLHSQAAAPAGDHQTELDAASLAPGFYVCRLQAAGMVQSLPVVIAR